MNNTKSSKDFIVDTAIGLFKQKGFENVSIVEICKATSITRTTFYYHFKTKEELIEEYFKKCISSKEELFSNIIKLDNDWDRYLELYNIHIQFFMDEGIEFTKQIIKINLEDENNLYKNYFLTETWCIPILTNCQKNGLIRNDLDAKRLDYLATNLVLGILSLWCGSNGDFDIKKDVKEALESLLKK